MYPCNCGCFACDSGKYQDGCFVCGGTGQDPLLRDNCPEHGDVLGEKKEVKEEEK